MLRLNILNNTFVVEKNIFLEWLQKLPEHADKFLKK